MTDINLSGFLKLKLAASAAEGTLIALTDVVPAYLQDDVRSLIAELEAARAQPLFEESHRDGGAAEQAAPEAPDSMKGAE